MVVVFDASSIVGAALKHDSTPMRALQAARERDAIALSGAVYDEIREVLSRPKFADALPLERQQEILELLSAAAIWVEPNTSVADCPDPDDNKYLELAVSSGASIIVSSDKDLLNMHPWRGVMIIRPASYLAR
ncbi:MAG: putative toxin-antitoxin system toxin component, PIN family, partial [Acetobacteraceae bacterium]